MNAHKSLSLRTAFLCLCLGAPAFAQYAGPAILSRGEAPSGVTATEIRFAPYASVAATYDTGLATTQVNDNGQLGAVKSYGYTVGWGVSGNHHWRHTTLGLSYGGSINRYAQETAYSSVNQSLMLGVTHAFTRHITLSLHNSAGMSSRNYAIGGLSETTPFDPNSTYQPQTDFFDNRTVYVTSAASLTIQKTARLSFNFGGVGFLNNRESRSLTDAWGTAAQGDVQYRISRRTTIGGFYQHMHFGYSRVNGGTDGDVAAASYSIRLSRFWEASFYGGAAHVESKYVQVQAVDPVIAALLGITQTVQISHTVQVSPYTVGRLSRSMRRGVFYGEAGRTIAPGNGLFLTSTNTFVDGGYSYTGFHRWSANVQVSYVSSDAQGNIVGAYSTTTGTASLGRQLNRYLHFAIGYTARNYASSTYANYNRRIDTAYVSLGFSPGEVRLPVL